ncbi:MAG: tyrosine-type recombinase/integrase [Geobacter sp.]|nr:tyrosine-type recombinase/integrase [Geobacter sp.]
MSRVPSAFLITTKSFMFFRAYCILKKSLPRKSVQRVAPMNRTPLISTDSFSRKWTFAGRESLVFSSWMRPKKSLTGHTVNIKVAFRRVVADAELSADVCRHTLRHTAITHLVQAGVDLPTVGRISGHKTLAMVARYAHANGEHIQSATDKLESRYQHTG